MRISDWSSDVCSSDLDARDPLAHGTGFDRIGSFSEGYEAGPERCAEYPSLFESGELVIVEVPFTDQADFERGGDLPLEAAFPLAIQDLEHFQLGRASCRASVRQYV